MRELAGYVDGLPNLLVRSGVPSMALLFVTFQRGHDQDTQSGEARQPTVPPERA
jgi:hypothetical protein